MKKMHLILGLALSLCLCSGRAMAQDAQTSVSYIETFGMAETEVSPDKITLRIQLNEAEGKKKPLEELQKKMLDALTKMGLDVEKNLQVVSMQSSLKQYLLAKDDILQRRDFNLIVSDYATANKVFEVLEWLGISTAYIHKLELLEPEKAKLELKLKAIEDGKAQAQAMAKAAGAQLGDVLLIMDERQFNQYIYQDEEAQPRFTKALQVEAVSEPQIGFRTLKLKANVQLRFKLTPQQ